MIRKLPFTFDEFKSIYSRVPRLCVDLIVKNNNKIALIKRAKNGWEGMWHFPGGTVYISETLEEAVNRVTKEELGIEVSSIKFVGYMEFLDEQKIRGFGRTVSLGFLVETDQSELKTDDQSEKAEWFKTIPENIIVEQGRFLKNYNL